jgi:hypothetical protein
MHICFLKEQFRRKETARRCKVGDNMGYIKTLDDLSNITKLAQQEIDGIWSSGRQSSITRTGLILSDFPDGENGDDIDPNQQGSQHLLESWHQLLVEALLVYARTVSKIHHKFGSLYIQTL